MIFLSFDISWPFKWDVNFQKDYIEFDKKITKNKALSVQLSRMGNNLLGFELNYCPFGSDHAGLIIDLSLLRHHLIINSYDIRHWNYDENRWETYPGERE